MTDKQIADFIAAWSTEFVTRLADLENQLNKRVLFIQENIFDALLEQIRDRLDITDGRIERTAANIQRVNRFGATFDIMKRAAIARELRNFAAEVVDVANFSAAYFEEMDFGVKRSQVESALDLVRATIGISKDGAILPGSYLERLGTAAEVREEIRAYVVNAINSRAAYSDFTKGFAQLVKGGKDVDGAYLRYWRQYAYDTFNQTHEIVNGALAEDLKLKYFIYQGSVIDNTRDFCRKKAGKVFSTDEALKLWPNDPALIDKKTKAQYRPLIDRGRYNCRHFLTYISEATAKKLRPDL